MKSAEGTIWAPAILPGLSGLYSTKFNSTYSDFRKQLVTPFRRVQFSLIMNWFSIIFLVILSKYLSNFVFYFCEAVFLSLLMNRVLSIVHEGAHYHLSEDRSMNDRITNVCAGWFIFLDVRNYRKTHIQHHRGLGTSLDTENTHMDKLDLSWLIAAISGAKTALAIKKSLPSTSNTGIEERPKILILLLGAIAHLGIFSAIYLGLGWWPLLVWSVSLLVVTPMLGMLRNLLEHRYVEAVDPILWEIFMNSNSKAIEINQVTTRTFTQSIFSKFYGSMGFTRHLLHHWDPSISFMNLGKVHEFLLTSEVGELLKKTDTTYTRTFFYLLGK